jgi:sulfane dehydrogenase subunit SoxC
MFMRSKLENQPGDILQTQILRRDFLRASASVAGAAVAGRAIGETLAEVPARTVGDSLGAHSERSKFVDISRLPEGPPGHRNVNPAMAINSKTPLAQLVGTLTPADVHYERSHAGVPQLDPRQHRLLLHGMATRPLVLSLDDLKAMPSVSRIAFIECTGNGWENWKAADENLTVQNTHGMISTSEWTGVPLQFILELVGVDRKANWMLAEGGDAAGLARSVPLTDEVIREALIAYGQNGEPIRPAHGFPMRLIMPGFEGNLNVKWLRRLKFGDQPWNTRWETARYTQLLANGKARQFQLRIDTNSVITTPSGMMQIQPGHVRVSGLAWSGHGKIVKVEVSADGGRTWRLAQLTAPALPRAQARFELDWKWDGKPAKLVSRSTDEKGNVQPDRKAFVALMGTNAVFHYNAQQTWAIDDMGRVRNVLD